ncbi:peptidoglycan-binding protein [Spirulina subsalsa FACHB-351]|uniref:Peptidoglycan-binding protein n=1 Tax=Spirulina subsalsa FACHB-351 TaxID=234711 RepID=A0ABT3L7A6_9CYAN|nr:peptidoglycan-binding protein [Spirulina subsalsa]MCW6037384.1 peptidoglycan-binding protein [Spirulina subsalsa FACHB-351]
MMESLAYLHHALAYEDDHGDSSLMLTPTLIPEGSGGGPSGLWRRGKGRLVTVGMVLGGMVLGLWGASSEALASAMTLLREGDRGSHVQAVQVQLSSLGYLQARPTGYFGPATREAVIRLQREHGLTPDGVIGPQTQVILNQRQRTVTPSAPEITANLLRQGDRNSQVRTLQQALQQAGVYNGPITGYFGNQTEAAVRRFQQQRGLPVDGIVGAQTLNALQSTPTPTQPFTSAPPTPLFGLGSQGNEVREIQQRLNSLGYLAQAPSGVYDEATEAAVRNFQRDRNLAIDGQVGGSTFNQLRSAISAEQVRSLQQRLQQGGFYRGPIDGVWGPQTQQALESAQRLYGVSMGDVVQGNY